MRKYLLYAIGEIVLVVAGILIALYINKSVQEAENRRIEEQHLVALLDEFREAEAVFNHSLTMEKRVIGRCAYLIEICEGLRQYNPDSITHFFNVFSLSATPPPLTELDKLLTSGHINLIQNEYIKNGIAKYRQELGMNEIAKEWENSQWSLINQPFINKNMDFKSLAPPDVVERLGMQIGGSSTFPIESLFESQEFKNILFNRVVAADDTIQSIESILRTIDFMIGLLEKEIEERKIIYPAKTN